MRTIMASRRVLGWLGLLATVAGCTATSASSHAAAGQGRSASPAASTVSPRAASGSVSAGPGGARNLAVSQAVRSELTAAYVGYRGISLSDVAGTEPGSVYYAYDPATNTYWARATFMPSSTASSKVLVGFQDGADIGLFARAARSGWQVELGGEPVVCAEVVFFPPAVLRAWSLSTATAASFGCRSQPARQLSSKTFAATISIPADWQPTPDYIGQFAYDGPSGWVELDAATDPSGLHSACTGVATGNVLHPYGLHPQIIYRTIDGRPGCLILPSSDAPGLSRRTGYPAFQDSAALVEYRQPVTIGRGCASPTGRPGPAQPCMYSLLVIDADPAHLAAIADSVQLHH